MVLRGLIITAGMGVVVIVCAGFILGPSALGKLMPNDKSVQPSATLSLAPISLGNPTTAATLRAFRLGNPEFPEATDVIALHHQTVRARRGDTLAGILIWAGAKQADAEAAIAALRQHYDPRGIRAGQEIRIAFTPHSVETAASEAGPGHFEGFSVEPDLDHQVRVTRGGGGFVVHKINNVLTRTLAFAESSIDLSLYAAGKKVGLPDATLVELIRAYSWDIDFQRDIRRGDSFKVIYERITDAGGRLMRASDIAFATLTLGGKRHAIYRFTTDDGHTNYYDEKGRSARKALMRTPIDGARLSSGYGQRRHPILGYNKMHRGVDFAAPRGTPIYAAGNGTITYAGRNGAYGIYCRVRHNSKYSSAYAHMNSLARGMRRGKRVKQGQIIGYVGTTGRSTGPHLHYEILRSSVQTNPMRVKMPSGRKLNGVELTRFQAVKTSIDTHFTASPTAAKWPNSPATPRAGSG